MPKLNFVCNGVSRTSFLGQTVWEKGFKETHRGE